MNLLAVYGSTGYLREGSHLSILMSALSERIPGCTIAVEHSFMDYMLGHGICVPGVCETFDTYPAHQADLALSIGGDGTFLSTVHMLADTDTPVMGINSGRLGYLSAAEISQAADIVTDIAAGRYITQQRSLLAVDVADSDGTSAPTTHYALNEVALLRRDTASMISVNAVLNSHRLASYFADGLIVSTPTGSTAYNLSAGGPIAAPDTGIWIITPVAPHTLNMRPLVVADSSDLKLSVESRSDSVLLSIDGKATPISAMSTISVSKAPRAVRVALLTGHNFIDTLRRKLLWGYS